VLEIAVRQAILHALVAASFTEAVLRAWGIRRAVSRLRFWLLALAFPFLVLPAFLVLAPGRSTDWFAAGRALLCVDRWSGVRVAGLGVDEIAFGVLGVTGALLFLRDAAPSLSSSR
jgi:voltage-gated potassium channel Kch